MHYYIFDGIPGQSPEYSVAVLAVSLRDAQKHMRYVWHGGKHARTIERGEVVANCGAITDAAGDILHRQVCNAQGWAL